jgi:hypothetical protein
LGKSPDPRAAKSGAVDAREGPVDPDLALVAERWATLSAAVRAQIVAMVKAAGRE